MVESCSDEILANADKEDVAFLIVGDPFGYFREPFAVQSIQADRL